MMDPLDTQLAPLFFFRQRLVQFESVSNDPGVPLGVGDAIVKNDRGPPSYRCVQTLRFGAVAIREVLLEEYSNELFIGVAKVASRMDKLVDRTKVVIHNIAHQEKDSYGSLQI
jgi:hypothetical protein